MLLEPSAEDAAILESFQRYLDRHVTPLAANLGEAPPTKGQAYEFLRGLSEFGVGGLYTPVEHGGLGANNVLTARLIEALCREDVCVSAAIALGRIGPPAKEAIEPLTHLKRRKLGFDCWCAEEALRLINA